jgi:lipopolysaccharide biosynthesis glycosyltransferase
MAAADQALVFTGDEPFALGLGVAVDSALAYLPPAVRPEVYILDNGLTESSRSRIERIVERHGRSELLHWVTPPTTIASLPTDARYSPVVYLRLLIPALVPNHISRVVSLDADVLVREDLSPLLWVSLEGAPLGAIRDFGIPTTDDQWSGVRERANPRAYFNAGVLVIDLPVWRETGVGERALAYAAAGNEPLPYNEQDALNATVERWHQLDDRWNVQPYNLPLLKRMLITDRSRYRCNRQLFRSAAIIHFAGPKPWWPTSELPGTAAWITAFARSRWLTPRQTLVWLARWTGSRMRRWPQTIAARWRLRAAALRRAHP